jgi:hypothetical protein
MMAALAEALLPASSEFVSMPLVKVMAVKERVEQAADKMADRC